MYVGQLKSHVLQFFGVLGKMGAKWRRNGYNEVVFLCNGTERHEIRETRVCLSGQAITIEWSDLLCGYLLWRFVL